MKIFIIVLLTALLTPGVSSAECPILPEGDCTISDQSYLKIKDGSQLKYKWMGGDVDYFDFGRPGVTSYDVCVYDSDLSTIYLIGSVFSIPAIPRPLNGLSWSSFYGGHKFRKDGMLLKMKANRYNRGHLIVNGRRDNVSYPVLPLMTNPGVVVQVYNSRGVCWSSYFSSPLRNQSDSFIARH